MIRFENVGHRYGDREVLADISLDLGDHRVGIIGANGSGKSTLARMINGLVHPTTGRVEVDGIDPVRHGAQVRKHVSFLFADPDAQIVMPTVGEDIEFSLRRAKISKEESSARVAEILQVVGLPDHVDHPAHHLSSGQKQLLAMAAILVTEPRILVCDEPTTLLDLRNAQRLHGLIDSLEQQVVLVTHHLDLVEPLDRVIVLDEGHVVADGSGVDSVAFYRRLMA